MKLKNGGYQPEFPTQSDIPPMPPTKRISEVAVRIMFYDKLCTRLNNVARIDTNDKDFIVFYKNDNTTSFYNRADIEELHISPQEKE